MSLKRRISQVALALPLLTLVAGPAEAHRRWLLPSMTVMAGDEAVATVDAAVSNELFVFEHRPLSLDGLSVTGPDGEAVEPNITGSGAYRSSFDVPLKAEGTYRIAVVNGGIMGSYMLDGERKRWRGEEAELADAIPAEATEVNISLNNGRTETFVTLGAPNDVALQPTGVGLEMIPVTHPNDLVAGEAARFQFLVDGKPVSAMEIDFVAGGTRYRDVSGEEKLIADDDGIVEIMAEQAGLYFLEASTSEDLPAGGKINSKRSSYTAVLEFLPL